MITLTAGARYGYGGKQYIARITGRDPKFTFRREFVGRKGGKRGEDSTFDTDEPGLYETRDIDSKGRPDDSYRVIMEDDSGDLQVSTLIDKEVAMRAAKRLEAGERIERIFQLVARDSRRNPGTTVFDAEEITEKQAVKKDTAKTVDAATEACWDAIKGLSAADAKKVLAALRKRVVPPKTPGQVGLTEDAPVGIVSDANLDSGESPESMSM